MSNRLTAGRLSEHASRCRRDDTTHYALCATLRYATRLGVAQHYTVHQHCPTLHMSRSVVSSRSPKLLMLLSKIPLPPPPSASQFPVLFSAQLQKSLFSYTAAPRALHSRGQFGRCGELALGAGQTPMTRPPSSHLVAHPMPPPAYVQGNAVSPRMLLSSSAVQAHVRIPRVTRSSRLRGRISN